MEAAPLRVVQWGSGAIGRSVLRGLLDRPEFRLAGLRVYDPAKRGADAGTLVGRAPAGVLATDDPDEILALDADCVVYAPLPGRLYGGDDLDTVCRLLASGKNVVSLTGFVYPPARGPEFTGALEDACAKGRTSVHGTGINPGFTGEKLPLVLSGLARRVDHLYVRDCYDLAGHPSRRIVHELSGFGKTEEEYTAALPQGRSLMRGLYTESLHLLAAALGVELDDVDLDHEYLHAREDFAVAAGPVPRGTVAADRWTLTGRAGGFPLITLEIARKADARRIGDWYEPGYALRVQGTPSMSLTLGEDWIGNGVTAAAGHALNSIAAVCAAPPGVRTLLDLPLLPGRFGGGIRNRG
ncbi:NAD(P)H-dependent amine dehydrogenase family protein [Actinocorallia populi]|uniref:NAD(P)H-dependent amine dehydrogenase family protein n=1 Tax=Actinocorallia populi TaxID=2079200 RepID=UPI000D08BBC4|nr:dihydrodipicolinate reductase [Actinocorallia populi]